jgi:hypothetical protein
MKSHLACNFELKQIGFVGKKRKKKGKKNLVAKFEVNN